MHGEFVVNASLVSLGEFLGARTARRGCWNVEALAFVESFDAFDNNSNILGLRWG